MTSQAVTLIFLEATGMVTGSKYLLEASGEGITAAFQSAGHILGATSIRWSLSDRRLSRNDDRAQS